VLWDVDLERQNASSVESEIHRLGVLLRADHESGNDQQECGDRRFRSHKHRAQASAPWSAASSGETMVDRLVEVASRSAYCGKKPEQQRGCESEAQRQPQGLVIERKLGEVWRASSESQTQETDGGRG
jgi:hypothetical protein